MDDIISISTHLVSITRRLRRLLREWWMILSPSRPI